MEGHNVEGQAVACGYEAAHLYVLLGGAVALVRVEAYAYVEKVWRMALLHQTVHGHGAVHASRYKHCDVHVGDWGR